MGHTDLEKFRDDNDNDLFSRYLLNMPLSRKNTYTLSLATYEYFLKILSEYCKENMAIPFLLGWKCIYEIQDSFPFSKNAVFLLDGLILVSIFFRKKGWDLERHLSSEECALLFSEA